MTFACWCRLRGRLPERATDHSWAGVAARAPGAPLGFVARALCSWQERWDDPRREYRTLYCAQRPETCLIEVLADLRPNTSMLADLGGVMGESAELLDAAGVVESSWRERPAVRASAASR